MNQHFSIPLNYTKSLFFKIDNFSIAVEYFSTQIFLEKLYK